MGGIPNAEVVERKADADLFIVLGLAGTFGPARGAPGFWLAAIASIWLVGGMMAFYLNYTAKKQIQSVCGEPVDG